MGTTQEVWRIIIRKTHRHTHSFINTLMFTNAQREQDSPLRLLQGVPHGLDLLEMAGHICAHDHLDHQRPQLPVGSTTQRLIRTQSTCTFPEQILHLQNGTSEDIVSQRRVSNPSVPPVIFREVDQDVHLILLHESVGCAHMVVFQNRAIVVQDGHFWSVQKQRKRSQACRICSNYFDTFMPLQ